MEAVSNPARPSVLESALVPLRGIALLVSDGVSTLRRPLAVSWRSVVVMVFTLLIVLDLLTTQWMMRTNEFEEANPVALAGMEAVGLTTYICVVSALMALMNVFLAARPRHYAGWAAQVTVLSVVAVKAQVVGTNLFLLASSLTS